MHIRSALPVLALAAATLLSACAWHPITEQDVRNPKYLYKKWVFQYSLEEIAQSFEIYTRNCDHALPLTTAPDDPNHATLLYPTGVASFEKPSVVALVDFARQEDGSTLATVYVHEAAYYLQERTVENLPRIIADPLRCYWQ